MQKKDPHVHPENALFKGKYHSVASTSNLGFIRANADVMRRLANDKNAGIEIPGMNFGVSWVAKRIHFFGAGFLRAGLSFSLSEWIQSLVLCVAYLVSEPPKLA